MQLCLQVHDHIIIIYVLDWVDVVSALSADPASELAQSGSLCAFISYSAEYSEIV